MIPARRTCPVGGTREYEGYLMSGYVTDMKTSYECVDVTPDVIGGEYGPIIAHLNLQPTADERLTLINRLRF